jgi:hypothetical protein
MNLQVPSKVGNFFISSEIISFSGALFHGVGWLVREIYFLLSLTKEYILCDRIY